MDLRKIRSDLEKSQIWLEKIKSELEVSSHSQNYDLVILDDIFPLRLSAFRIAEYNYYLNTCPNSLVLSTATAFSLLGQNIGLADVVQEYECFYPQFKGKVMEFDFNRLVKAKLIYTIFLNNIFNFIDFIEKNHLPFVFTLYPGGGFHIEEEATNHKLTRVFASPNFKKVIVTQRNTYEYLIDKKFCTPKQIEFIYGCVVPSDKLTSNLYPKKYYKQNKFTFDICFVAYKYQPTGLHKGYDLFIEVAKKLASKHDDFHFHIVGGHEPTDIDVIVLENNITFYGQKTTDFFPDFYSGMDLILSPNRPAYIPGAFDGFPTGACAEAALSGVALFCTDCLNLNVAFKDREELVIISLNVEEICETIEYFWQNYNKLSELAKQGQLAFQRVFNIDYQMNPRLRLISECMGPKSSLK
ncbi:glycosyltransferase family 4 protein [Microcoleus sp. Z1_B2]|uniref:glycosyltransferase family 4 protein n=1 Tax=Microcoleus sp. Z1_B2 TaxID=3055429 RepID=UPI002FD2E750